MTDFRINVIADPTQALAGQDAIGRSLTALEQQALAASKSISDSLGKAFSGAGGGRGGGGGGGAQTNALLAQIDALHRLEDAVNPVLKAERELAATQRQLNDAVKAGLVSESEAGSLLLRKQAALRGALNPLEATTSALREETRALRLSATGHQVEAQALAIEARLRQQGINVTRQQASELRRLVGERNKEAAAIGKTSGGGGGGVAAFARGAVPAIGGALVVREIGRAADAFTTLQNRIRVTTDNTDDLNSATEELFAIANRTRQDVVTTTEAFSRLSLATREMGLSQSEVLRVTESLNKAVILSGATGQEAAAGMIQLSQGLSSGALRGDELRSVLEQLPAVADVIAKKMGVTRGELRKLGADGKITADIVVAAFQEAGASLDNQFANSVPTIAQTFQVLRNEFIRFVGESSTEITGLVKSLVDLALALKPLASLTLGIASSIGSLVATAISGIAQIITLTPKDPTDTPSPGDSTAGTVGLLKGQEANLRRDILQRENELRKAQQDFDARVAGVGNPATLRDADILEDFARRQHDLIGGSRVQLGIITKIREVEEKILIQREHNLRVNAEEARKRDEELNERRKLFTALRDITIAAPIAAKKALEDARQAAEDAAAAFKKLKEETLALENGLFAGVRANREFAEAQKTVERAVSAGLLKPQRAAEILNAYAASVANAFGESEKIFNDQALSLGLVTQAAAALNSQWIAGRVSIEQYLEALEKLRKAGGLPVGGVPNAEDIGRGGLGRDQGGGLGGLVTPSAPRDEKKAETTADAIARINQETELLRLSEQQAEVEREIAQFKQQGTITTDSEEAQLRAALEHQQSIRDELDATKKQQDLLLAGATQFTDALVDGVFAGESLSDIFANLASDLAKAVIKALLLKAIMAAINPGGEVPKSILSGILPGFATGGAFTVGGSGGTDSQLVAFRATPGETVDVRTPGQQRSQQSQAAPAAAANVRVLLVADMRQAALEAMRSEAGEQIYIEHVDRNRGRFQGR